MKDIFVHLDNLKKIFKEKDEKSKLKKDNLNNISNKNNMNINNHSNSHYSSNNFYYNNYKKSTSFSRPSILDLKNNIKNIDFSHKFYLIEEGSDSEDCFNEDTKEVLPSLMKVAKNIFDPNKIMIITDIKYFPKEANPGLIMTGIEEWVTERHIKFFLENVPTFVDKYKKNSYYKNFNNYGDNYLDIYKITIFAEQKNRYAYIQMNNFSQMEIIGNFFLNPIKKIHPSYNSKKEKIEIYYAYNILELTKNHWYGVILRNLPANCNDKSLYYFTEQKVENGIKYCLNPILIDNVYCSLVVCKELECAEQLCFELNNHEINNKIFKAHLHPYICKIRNKENFNNYETFSKNGYEYNYFADESEKCIEFSKNFMEFFFPNYFNSFRNNKIKKKEEENKVGEKNDNTNENKNKIKIKEKSNNKRKKDLTLASSILNLFRSKSIEEKKKMNSLNSNTNISQKNNNNEEQNINNNKILKENNKQKKEQKDIINKPISNTNSQINMINNKELNSNKQNSILLNQVNNKEKKENKIPDINTDKNNNDLKNNNMEIKNENSGNNIDTEREPGEMDIPNTEPKPLFTEKEINYYTYDMGDRNYYEEKEKEEQRRNINKYKKNNYNYNNYNNYNNHGNYNNYINHNNHNNYNNYSYKKYNYKNNSPHHYYSTNYKTYKKYNYRDIDKDRERERDRDKSNDIYFKSNERSREKITEEEKMNKNRDIKYNDYEKRKDYKYSEDTYKKYNENKYYDKNNKYYDRERYSRNSQNKEDKDINEKRERYTNNNFINFNKYSFKKLN